MIEDLMIEQARIEEEMRGATRNRYFRTHQKAEERDQLSETHVGVNVLEFTFKAFLEELKVWVADRKEGKAGRRPKVVKMIEGFDDIESLAYIFVKHLIDTTLTLQYRDKRKIARLTRVALATTQAIHDELRMRYFAENRKALLKKIVKDFERRELPRRRRRELMIKQFHTQQLEWKAEGWDQKDRLQLGITLLDIFRRSTGMIEEYVHIDGKKTVNCIAFTEETISSLGDRMDKAADLFTVFYPTVIPPRPWSNDALIGGGYYTDNVKPYRFVKNASHKYLAELENRDMSKVIEPINAMQNTAWRVNPVMINVVQEVFSRSIDVAGLPPADPKPLPAPPVGYGEDEQATHEHRRDCYIVHDFNRRNISKRISVLRTLSLAKRFAGYDAIYFPYDLDNRGRVYPKVPFLNPQGTDYVKALLEFSEGKPIRADDYSAFYLTIAIANAWGHDKLPLEERAAWVEENEELLLSVARDPLGDLRWIEAGEPFMALRGAMEWLGYCEYGEGYLSHMPVHFDATCSGLQHFSALLLDEVGGFHVNLTGSDQRQDIYGAVAQRATETLGLDTSDIAKVALEMGITRALCKRPVMIVPYAGTFNACMDYVHDHYRERMEGGEVLPVDEQTIRNKVSPLVAKHVWNAISETVIAAREAMDWITKTARMASKDQNTPIQWTTPDGFVVQQARYEETNLKVNTFLDGNRRIQSIIVKETSTLDARKMSQSLSPNYIHSLDACHMRAVISKVIGLDADMSFAMIHDSFGVHAADMHRFLHECIKPAFVEMYEGEDLLAKFRDEIIVNIKPEERGDIPDLPEKGHLDIQEVLNSQFFFS